MKKNLYKYAALAQAVETLSQKVESLRYSAQSSLEYYKDSEDGVPAWAQEEIDKNNGIADFLEDFISKL